MGAQLEEWDELKQTVSDILIEQGATIAHHMPGKRSQTMVCPKQTKQYFSAYFKITPGVDLIPNGY